MLEAGGEPLRPDEAPRLDDLLAAVDNEAPAATEEYPLAPDVEY